MKGVVCGLCLMLTRATGEWVAACRRDGGCGWGHKVFPWRCNIYVVFEEVTDNERETVCYSGRMKKEIEYLRIPVRNWKKFLNFQIKSAVLW